MYGAINIPFNKRLINLPGKKITSFPQGEGCSFILVAVCSNGNYFKVNTGYFLLGLQAYFFNLLERKS